MKQPARKNFSFITVLLLFFTVLIIAGAFRYESSTRMLPLIVGVPTLVMLLFLVLGETIFPQLIRSFDIDLLHVKETVTSQPLSGEKIEVRVRWIGNKALLFVSGWLITFLVLIVLFGYNIAICVSVLGFVKLYGNQTWLRSLLVAIAVWAFTYIVFQYAMDLVMFPGLIFGGKIII